MIHSKKYNEKSYEAIRLKKEIAHLMDELEENNQSIKVGQNELKNFIDKKEELYKKLRKDNIELSYLLTELMKERNNKKVKK